MIKLLTKEEASHYRSEGVPIHVCTCPECNTTIMSLLQNGFCSEDCMKTYTIKNDTLSKNLEVIKAKNIAVSGDFLWIEDNLYCVVLFGYNKDEEILSQTEFNYMLHNCETKKYEKFTFSTPQIKVPIMEAPSRN